MKAPRGPSTVNGVGVAVVTLTCAALVTAACNDSPECVPPQIVDSGRCPDGYLLVPGGTFKMGGYGEYTATLTSDFCMGKTEVTVAEYRDCRDVGGCTGDPPLQYEIWGCNYSDTDQSRDDHPVNCVTYEQAREYCLAQGGDLPTEAQWSRAAQGEDRRVFPWGSCHVSCSRANYDVNGPPDEVPNGQGCAEATSPPYTWAVGSAPAGASPYGLLDMAGNVREYVQGCDYRLQACEGELGCVDPQPVGCDEAPYKLALGSSFGSWESNTYLYKRSWYGGTDDYTAGVGMRCVVAAIP